MKQIYSLQAILVACLTINNLWAQDQFEEVEVLDHPRFSLTDKIVLDVDLNFLPLDGYVKPIMVDVAVQYQISDFIALEPVRFGYSLYNHDTGLKKSIENVVSAETGQSVTLDEPALKDMKYHVGSAAYLNLLYSKSNFFNRSISYHYWQVGAGIDYYNMDAKDQIGLTLATRVRFFLNDSVTFNIRGGHTIGFKSDAPDNITFLGMGVGFAF